jgi:N-acetylmuramic acid 6-phosphate etherase
MIRLGRTYSNLMVNMVATNEKLHGRLVRILVEATGLDEDDCAEALVTADGEVTVALVCLLGAVPADVARAALTQADGIVREALAQLSG